MGVCGSVWECVDNRVIAVRYMGVFAGSVGGKGGVEPWRGV